MIHIPAPAHNSKLTKLVVELSSLKDHAVSGTTPVWIFFELKNLFHIVEALSSARIEGNHTTLATFVEKKLDKSDTKNEKLIEISNLIEALSYIDDSINEAVIDKDYVFALHRIVVRNLSVGTGCEGDKRPGAYRRENRAIAKSSLVLPQHYDVPDLMTEFYDFLQRPELPQDDLLKIAIAHHRFVQIHPFGNGNGRVVRLLTYAMLCKKGYIIPGSARLFNPTAVFAGDRDRYYEKLSQADKGDDASLAAWCEYVLDGLKTEVEKSQKFADHKFVQDNILLPAFSWALEKNVFSELEYKILVRLARKSSIKAGDIRDLWPADYSHVVVSKQLRKLRRQGFITTLKPKGRSYVLKLTGNKATRGILDQMDAQGLLPIRVDDVEHV